MWTTSNGYSRALASVATAGAVAFAASGVTAMPATALAGPVPSATVFAPVELTALSSDSSLMDIIGTLTGLNWIIPFLDDPENPIFPIVISLEALGELFFVIPLTVAVGAPLLLLTEGLDGFADLGNILGSAIDGVESLFHNMVEWYQTHNWLTGALLDTGSSEAGDIAGLGEVLHLGGWDELVSTLGLADVFPADGFDAGVLADGFDTVLTDIGLGDLIA